MQSSRIYPPKEARTGSAFSGLAELLEKKNESDWRAENDSAKDGRTADREMQLENLKAAHASRLEQQKAKNRLSEKLALAAEKGRKPKKYKDTDMLEQHLLQKGWFPKAMKVAKTRKGTANFLAHYNAEDQMGHIANLAQLRGWVPDGKGIHESPTDETEGGIVGIGAKPVMQTVRTYKPGPDVGGSIENVAPDTGDKPQPSKQE